MNILTFDIEEWYCNFVEPEGIDKTYSIKDRLLELLSLLDEYGITPTFFVVSSFAERHPEIIHRIAQKYDIGSHSSLHMLAQTQSYNEFYKDIVSSIESLEKITGKKITKYRTPGFSIPNNEYLKILFDTPIEIDCSLCAKNHFYGKKILDTDEICLIEHNKRTIKEFPPTVLKVFNKEVGFLGGGYFRLFPYFMIKNWIKKHEDYNITYLHPSDFDINQPHLNIYSSFEKFKRYHGIQGAEKKLLRLFKDFSFIDIQKAESMINWQETKIIHI
ncbi:MAG: DUF3473 domain-containing protein [Bacteroidales bacterium]|nr:DUF3473 domain-containing protein [Bacteroidales bacterium]